MPRTTRPNQKPGIAHRETLTRINYMYQAQTGDCSLFCCLLHHQPPALLYVNTCSRDQRALQSDFGDMGHLAAHLVLTQNPSNTELIRYYAYTLKSMAKKQVLRLHPDIKRTICKKCFMLLVSGVTATVRKKGKNVVVKCLECETPKRFPTGADYKLWSEQPEAWFAMFPPEAPLPVPCSSNSQGAAVSQDDKAPQCEHRRCKDFSYCRREVAIKRRQRLRGSSHDKQKGSHKNVKMDGTSESEGLSGSMTVDCTRDTTPEQTIQTLQEGISLKPEKVPESKMESLEINGEINANKTERCPNELCVTLNTEADVESAKFKAKSCDTECEIVSVSGTLKRPSIDDSIETLRLKRRRSNEKEMYPR